MSRVAREIVEAIVLALIVFLVIQTGVRNFKVEGSSMLPTLEGGQYLLVNKLVYFRLDTVRLSRVVPFWKVKVEESNEWFALRPPQRGEIIVFHYPRDPTKDFVKRVIGLPGENVVVEDGSVVINGQSIDDPYANHKAAFGDNFHDTREPFDVPEGEYFAMGDNRENSRDSRYWGSVPASHIKGKAMLVYWSYESGDQEYVVGGIRERLMQFGNVLLHFFTRTRWSRTFKIIG